MPQPNYKKIAWNQQLRNSYLIHFTNAKENIDPNTNKLRIDLVVRNTDHLRDYSNNLLGIFTTDDIYWKVEESLNKPYFTSDWIIGDSVKQPIIPDDFNKDSERGYFFLKIKDCHTIPIEYSDDTETITECILLHTPTNSNFWHFSLRWYCDGVDILEWSTNRRRRILTAAKIFIIERAFFTEPLFEEISTEHYTTHEPS